MATPAKMSASSKASGDTSSEAAAGDSSTARYWCIPTSRKPAEASSNSAAMATKAATPTRVSRPETT